MAIWMVALATACVLGDVSGFNMVVDKRLQIIKPSTSFSFICKADVPLVGCQIKGLYTNTVYDLSEGSRSRPSGSSYFGTGLENGQCGYTRVASGKVNEYYSYSCRSRSRSGEWQYATAVAHRPDPNNVNGVLPLVTSPRTVLADPGSDVTLTFAAGEPLVQCSFQWPGQTTWVNHGSTDAYSIDTSDLAAGRCRLTLKRVSSSHSGIVTSNVRSAWTDGKYRASIHLTTLIVKMAPGAPALSLSNSDGVYNEGDVMEASCHVGPARPVARITWLLDYDVIQGVEPKDFSKTPWQFEAGDVTRKLSRKLSLADDGKELVCRVEQVALPGGVVEARKRITVRRVTTVAATTPTPTPKPTPTPISVTAEHDVIRTAVGFRSELACLVDFAPDVTVQWHRAGVPVQESAVVTTGRERTRHWLVLDDTAPEDLTVFTCTASRAGVSASKDIQLSGFPGTPVWVANQKLPSWRVESVTPLIDFKLKIRQGKGRWQVFTDLDLTEEVEPWQLVTSKRLPVPVGNYTVFLQVKNEQGWSAQSALRDVVLDSDATDFIWDFNVRQGEASKRR